MSKDTDSLIKEALAMNKAGDRIQICFDDLDGSIGFDIDFRKRASLMCHLQGITPTTYPKYDDEGNYTGYVSNGRLKKPGEV